MVRERLSLEAIGSAIYRRPPFGTDDGRFNLEDGPFCRHGEAVGSLCCRCGDGERLDGGQRFAYCQHVNGSGEWQFCPVEEDPLAATDAARGQRVLAELRRYKPEAVKAAGRG